MTTSTTISRTQYSIIILHVYVFSFKEMGEVFREWYGSLGQAAVSTTVNHPCLSIDSYWNRIPASYKCKGVLSLKHPLIGLIFVTVLKVIICLRSAG